VFSPLIPFKSRSSLLCSLGDLFEEFVFPRLLSWIDRRIQPRVPPFSLMRRERNNEATPSACLVIVRDKLSYTRKLTDLNLDFLFLLTPLLRVRSLVQGTIFSLTLPESISDPLTPLSSLYFLIRITKRDVT